MVGTRRPRHDVALPRRHLRRRATNEQRVRLEVTCSYLEVYNELIYDLLVQDSPSLDLRDTPERGATVQGLQRIEVKNTDNVMDLLREGNLRRKTEPTEANAVSSRSHAVLEINVSRAPARGIQIGDGARQTCVGGSGGKLRRQRRSTWVKN